MKRIILWAALAALVLFIGVYAFFRLNADPDNLDFDIVEAQGVVIPDDVPALPATPSASTSERAEDTESPTQTNPSEQDSAAATICLGTLTIGNKNIPIASDVDEATLERSPGWMPDSALPGNEGMCVILGHRNRKHLRPLEKVKLGDAITFTYPDGKCAAYEVAEIIIYENAAGWTLPTTPGTTFWRICWPTPTR